ncbi:MAG: tRNA (adenosine(37)-N6)-dimethylallyltransferase MiaA [Kiritimatiellia bacterium]
MGSTATGKSAVAHYLALTEDYDILSADSMSVYRGMDIGTDKPPQDWRRNVRYDGIDLVDPDQPFSVADYCRAAGVVFRRARAGGRRVIVVGGTGLYLNCLIYGLAPRPPADQNLRKRADEILLCGGVAALQNYVKGIAPDVYAVLSDTRNPRRLVRALEIQSAGARPTVWPKNAPRIPGLQLERGRLWEKIENRASAMFDAGLLEETRRLADGGLAQAPTASQAIGYAEALACLAGDYDRQEAVRRIAARTRRLAKRQGTWLRHQLPVDWLEVDRDMPVMQQARMVLKHWQKHGPTPVNINHEN